MELTVDDLRAMKRRELQSVVATGHAVDPDAVAGWNYLGIDLSLPGWLTKILWKKFRKTFYRDPETDVVRGWNVRLVQNGLDSPHQPMQDRHGGNKTFGHYHLLPAAGLRFPGGWQGESYLDYRVAGNTFFDFGRFGYCPLVAVNAGNNDLLLGWEVFKIGPLFLPLPDYWLLKRDTPLADSDIEPPPIAA